MRAKHQPIVRWVVAGLVVAAGLSGCASPAPAPERSGTTSAGKRDPCQAIGRLHAYALKAHPEYRGWTPELAANVAGRFLQALDPFELFFSDAERVALRGAALVTDPGAIPKSCDSLRAVGAVLAGTPGRLRARVLDAMSLPEPTTALASVTLPKGPRNTPEQRDASLVQAARHHRALFVAAGLSRAEASAQTLAWLDGSVRRFSTPDALLREFQQAFVRSLSGENALLPDAYAQLEAMGAEDPLTRAVRHDWVPEVTNLAAWGLESAPSGLRLGDRIVGIELVGAKDGAATLFGWVGQGPGYEGAVLPCDPSKPFRYRVLRRDAAGGFRGELVEGRPFGPTLETRRAKGVAILWARATQFDAEFIRRLDETLRREPPGALVLDLRAATFPAELVLDVFAGVFLHDTVWGYLRFRDGRWVERRSLGTPPSWNGPVVIVVGPNTRGPAESLAAGLQGAGRAVVVGSARTAGQGGAAFVTDWSDGGYALFTVAMRFAPDGRPIDGTGIVPDIPVQAAASRVLPRLGVGEPLVARAVSEGPWRTVKRRQPASTALPKLKPLAARAAKIGGPDPVGAAAMAVAEALARLTPPPLESKR